MKSTCVLIIVCAMNVNFSRFNNNKPAAWRVFCGRVGCFSVGAWGVFLWVRWCVGLWGFMFFVGLWGFIEDYQFMGDLWWDLR